MDVQKGSKIYQLQAEYVNGEGEHGAVHKQYAGILEGYRAAYAKCPIYSQIGVMDLYRVEQGFLKKGVITDAVLLALSILGFGGWIIWCILSFVVAIAKFVQVEGEQDDENNPEINNVSMVNLTGESGRWSFLPIVIVPYAFICFLFQEFGGVLKVDFAWFIYSAPLIIDLCKRLYTWKVASQKYYEQNKQRILEMRQGEAGLEKIRGELKALLPALGEEYKKDLNEAVKDMADAEAQAILQQHGALPEQFWWEVNPSRILEKEMFQESLYESSGASHEVSYVVRGVGREFAQAGENYAPMLSEALTQEQMVDAYQKNIRRVETEGGAVVDFVDCIKFTDIVQESQVVKDYDYAEDSFTRAVATDEWSSLGSDIEQAYKDGILSDAEYKNLSFRYNSENREVRSYINRKVEVGEHIETHNKLRIFGGFEWTGQALLLPDMKNEGYILLDYRCRPEFELQNLKYLGWSGFSVTGIMADYTSGQQDFIAKMQQIVWEDKAKLHRQKEKKRQQERKIQQKENGKMRRNPCSSVSIILGLLGVLFINGGMLGRLVLILGLLLGWIGRKKEFTKDIALVGMILNGLLLLFVIIIRPIMHLFH